MLGPDLNVTRHVCRVLSGNRFSTLPLTLLDGLNDIVVLFVAKGLRGGCARGGAVRVT